MMISIENTAICCAICSSTRIDVGHTLRFLSAAAGIDTVALIVMQPIVCLKQFHSVTSDKPPLCV